MSVKAQPSLPTNLPRNEEFAKRFRRRTRLEYEHVMAYVIEEADPQPGDRVLDVMSEEISLALQLIPKVMPGHIININPTEAILEQAYRQAQDVGMEDQIDWRMVPIENLPFPNDSFDIVTCTLAFRLLDTQAFIAQVFRVLVPGGRLIITEAVVPQTRVNDWRNTVRTLYYKHYEKDQDEANAHFHSADELTDLLLQAGFEPVIIRGLQKPKSQHSWVYSLVKGIKR